MAVQHNNSVARAFAILDLFTFQRPQLAAADIVRELGLNAITAYRFLRSLESVGAVVAVSRGRYALGYRLVDLAGRITRHRFLSDALQPVLNWLTDTLNEASMAAVFEAKGVVCIAAALPSRRLLVDVRPGMSMEPHCTSQGKLWLASLGQGDLEKCLDRITLDEMTANTITDKKALLNEIETVRNRGYAISDGEREVGLCTLAMPFSARDGQALLGVSIYGPSARMTDELMVHARQLLGQAMGKIDAGLYGAPLGETSGRNAEN